MATINVPDCPKCGQPMLPNTAGKQRNPKAPDWKCSDQNCKFQQDKKTGNWVISEYITSIWDNAPTSAEIPATWQNTPHKAYPVQPKAEIKRTMDYKSEQIGKAQDNKEEGIRLFSSGRDATMIVTTMYAGNAFTDEQIQEKIKEWRNWFYKNIYSMSEDEYQILNSPF